MSPMHPWAFTNLQYCAPYFSWHIVGPVNASSTLSPAFPLS